MHSNRVLIVDDALIIRMRIKEIARSAGWEIAGEATNGEEAVKLFRAENPDLVTMDIVMPKMDGVSALNQIMESNANARVVMVSAVSQRDKLTECIQSGARDFIVKPFDKDSLSSLFERYRAKEGD